MFTISFLGTSNGTKYSRMEQVKMYKTAFKKLEWEWSA